MGIRGGEGPSGGFGDLLVILACVPVGFIIGLAFYKVWEFAQWLIK
jgi:hypothetical protein